MRKGQRGKKVAPAPKRLALSPKDRLRQQAYTLRNARDFVGAKPLLARLFELEPKDMPLALDYGEALMETEDFAGAVSLYAKLIESDPKNLAAVTNLGGALIRQGKLSDARSILEYALELDPKSIHARINLGSVLQASGERKANLDNALEAVQIDPSSSLAFNNLGSAFSDMAMFKEAKHAYETAVMLDTHQVDALINLGAVETRLGDFKASCEIYEKVITQLPAAAKQRTDAVKFYAAFEYLKQGVLDKGWDYYEGGFSPLVPATGARTPRRNFNVPRWDGEPIAGKTLLVWREQGLGDELLFATCLHELETLGASIIVECDRRLVQVFERSFPNYKIRQETYLPNHGMVSPYSDFDLHVPLGSLMKHFRRDIKDFERSGAFIKTDPAKVAKFAERLAPYKDDYRLVGICWRSGKLDPVRNLGYTNLDDWGEVLQTPGLKFVNLQYGECEAELKEAEEKYGIEILRWPDVDLKNNLEDVFSLMSCMTEVISVQTAVLVMAGALGLSRVGIMASGWTRLGVKRGDCWFGSLIRAYTPKSLKNSVQTSYLEAALKSKNQNEKQIDDLKNPQIKDDFSNIFEKKINSRYLGGRDAFELEALITRAPEGCATPYLKPIFDRLRESTSLDGCSGVYISDVLIKSFLKECKVNEASEVFEWSKNKRPSEEEHRLNIEFATNLCNIGEFDGARHYVERFLSSNLLSYSNNLDLLKASRVCAMTNEFQLAEELVQAVYDSDPNLKDGYWNIIHALTVQQRWKDCEVYIDREFSNGRASLFNTTRLLKICYENGGYERGQEFIQDYCMKRQPFQSKSIGEYSFLGLLTTALNPEGDYSKYIHLDQKNNLTGIWTRALMFLMTLLSFEKVTKNELANTLKDLKHTETLSILLHAASVFLRRGRIEEAKDCLQYISNLNVSSPFYYSIITAEDKAELKKNVLFSYLNNPYQVDVMSLILKFRAGLNRTRDETFMNFDVGLKRYCGQPPVTLM